MKADFQCEVVKFPFPASDFGLVFLAWFEQEKLLAAVHIGVLFTFCTFCLVFPRLVRAGEITCTSTHWCAIHFLHVLFGFPRLVRAEELLLH